MTDTQDLKRYKHGYSSDGWGMGRSLGLIPDPAGKVCLFADAHDKLEAAQAEIERLNADRRVLQADGKHLAPCAKFCEATAFTIELRRTKAERDQALARLAELEEALVYAAHIGHGTPQHMTPEGMCLFDNDGVQVRLPDGRMVFAGRTPQYLRDRYAAAGASPQPSQARELSEAETDAELALRSLASWLGVGGYNALKVDAKVFEQKIRDGVNMLHEKPQTLQSAIDKWVTDAGNNSVKPVAAINAKGDV